MNCSIQKSERAIYKKALPMTKKGRQSKERHFTYIQNINVQNLKELQKSMRKTEI